MTEAVEANEKLAAESNKSLADIESMQDKFANTTSMVAESVANTDSISSGAAFITESLGNVNSALESSSSQADQILNTAYSIRDDANKLKDNLSSFKAA